MTHSPRSLAVALPRLLLFLIGMTCLSLVALQPFTHGTLPYSADGLLQLYRTAALDHSLQVDQALWPRYASGLVYGYGAPLFNFFPPLSYYPALLAHRLGLSYLDSWLLTMSAFTVLAASGSFLLARLWTRSDLAGWLAAAAYIYSPYLLFDSINRGASAELAALAALPFALYGMTRLAFHNRRINLSLALLAFALFIPLHTLITLHGSALLALYCLFLVWRAHERRAVFLRLALAIALALLLTAFYWLPALLESDAIKLGLITEQLSHIDIERHLRPLSAILALPHTADPTQQNFPTPITLGWLQLLISTAGTLLSLRPAHRPHRSLLLTLSALVAALIFLNTPASAWLWKNIPLIGYTQFPWRTLGLASLLLALMTGISAALLLSTVRGARRATALITSLTLLLLLQGIPWTYSLHHSDTALTDIRDVQQFERDTGQLALSSYAEYLPINADAAHLDPLALATAFSSADTIPRLRDSDALTIHSAHWRGTSATLQLDSQQPQTLIFDWLYVPGFSAYHNSERIDTFPSKSAGLVALEIPAGTIDLRIALEPTPIQSLSLVISALGLLATAIVLLPRWLLWTPSASAHSRLQPRWLLTVAAIGIAVFFFKATLLDHSDTPFKRARFGPAAASPTLANFGNRIDLLAIDMPNAVIDQPTLTLTLFWRLHDAPLDRDYSSIIRLRDPAGHIIAEADAFAPGRLPTRNWLPGAYIEDAIVFDIPPFTPPLDQPYSFELSLYDAQTLTALSLINEAGNPQDVKLLIASLPLRLTAADFQSRNLRPLPSSTPALPIALIQAPQLPAAATVGAVLPFNWTWQKAAEPASILQAQFLFLHENAAETWRSVAFPLVSGYALADWQLGEVSRGHHQLILPPHLPAGTYTIAIALHDHNLQPVGDPLTLAQTMTVSLPERQFQPPDFTTPSGATWTIGIILHGYSLEATGDLTLVWGANTPLHQSLRLFLHILAAQDHILAQWDGIPVAWTRPTTGWLPGEFITTHHHFDLPPGDYHLALGWYTPTTGDRIPIGAADTLRLPQRLIID